jgi:DNA-binding transcriptional LysR family regulator
LNKLQIKYALALARYNNFTEAARSVYVSQPAFSKQIASLEKELGLHLFLRTSRSVEITPAGEVMIAAFKNISTLFDQAYQQAIQKAGLPGLHLTIGFLKDLGNHPIISRAMDRLIHTYPEAKIRVGSIGSTEIPFALESDVTDIFITLDREVKLYPDVISFPLYQIQLAIVVSSTLPLVKKRTFDFDTFHRSKIPVLVTKDVVDYEYIFTKACEVFGVDRSSLMVVSNIESMLSAVEAGLGVAFFSTTPRVVSNPAIRYFLLENEQVWVEAMWKISNHNPLVRTFIDLVQAEIKKIDKPV